MGLTVRTIVNAVNDFVAAYWDVLRWHSDNINAFKLVRKPVKQSKYERYLSIQVILNNFSL